MNTQELPDQAVRRDVPPSLRAWFVWALAASSFGYAFFQRVAPSVMVQDLMQEFAVGAAVLGNLSAIYLYAYAGLQIPIGILIDRSGPRRSIAIALIIAGFGSALFASATSIGLAYLGRLLIGIGCSVGFVGTLTLISRWFPPQRFAFMSGLTMFVAMASGIGAQAPLAFAVEAVGWRNTLYGGALLALVLAAAIALIVRDYPHGGLPKPRPVSHAPQLRLSAALRTPQVWNAGLIAGLLSAPMLAFGGLWGVPYLMERYAIERPEAAFYSSFILFGWALGAPAGGWAADYTGRRKMPLLIAAIVVTAAMAGLLYLPVLPPLGAAALIFAAGFSGGIMVNVYAYAREISQPELDGGVTGFINTFSVGSGALFQPLIGLLLDWHAAPAAGHTPHYALADYTFALTCLVVTGLVVVACTFSMQETFCRRRHQYSTITNYSDG